MFYLFYLPPLIEQTRVFCLPLHMESIKLRFKAAKTMEVEAKNKDSATGKNAENCTLIQI